MNNEFFIGERKDGDWTKVKILEQGLVAVTQCDNFSNQSNTVYISVDQLNEIMAKVAEDK
jgi:hypothetical protein